MIGIQRKNTAKKIQLGVQSYSSQSREIVGSEAFLVVLWSQKVKILFFLVLRFQQKFKSILRESEDWKKCQCGKVLPKLRHNRKYKIMEEL